MRRTYIKNHSYLNKKMYERASDDEVSDDFEDNLENKKLSDKV